MYTVLLQNESRLYFLGEMDTEDVTEWLTNDHLFYCMTMFLSHLVISYDHAVNVVTISMLDDTPCIFVSETLEGIETIYRLPFHAEATITDYFRYVMVLYTCEHAHELISQPQYVFNPWVYDSLMQSTFVLQFNEPRDGVDRIIYPRATWIMEEHEEVCRDQFILYVDQHHG